LRAPPLLAENAYRVRCRAPPDLLTRIAHHIDGVAYPEVREIMKAEKFLVTKRPSLASIKDFPHVDFAEYERRLKPLQVKLQLIQQAYLGTRHHALVVLEGWDTAGKGGVVRRLGWTLDPRSLKVHPIGAPSPHQKAQHYLERFWKKLPKHGQIVVFDRSWYGRVLVERVEKLATKAEWKRAYREINEFERMLVDDGAHIAKIFLHITPEEQVKRFKDRLNNPLKRWKLSYEDFRNRARWADYEVAIEDMMEKTSTNYAPWFLIPANDKPFGRLAVFSELIDRLGNGVDLEPKPLDPKTAEAAALLVGEGH
jgi:AMP-polyphosphate phosphotransferase